MFMTLVQGSGTPIKHQQVNAQSDQSLCLSLEYSMSVKLLTEHHLEFLSFKGGCTVSSESTLVKIPHCLKSHIKAQLFLSCMFIVYVLLSKVFEKL